MDGNNSQQLSGERFRKMERTTLGSVTKKGVPQEGYCSIERVVTI